MAAGAMDVGAAAARASSVVSRLGPGVHDLDRNRCRSRSPDSPFQELTPSPDKEQKRRGDRPPRTASKKRPGKADGPVRSASMPGPTRGMAMHAVLKKPSKAPRRGTATNRGAAKKQKIKLERAHGSRGGPVLCRAAAVVVAELVARPGSCARTFPPRKVRVTKVAGGVTFPKASFEARSCCWCFLPLGG